MSASPPLAHAVETAVPADAADVADLADELARGLRQQRVLPYVGPGALALCGGPAVPADPAALAAFITARVTVPHKIRGRLTQAAQFIENFKHRKSLVALMNEAFAATPEPSALHRALAAAAPPMIVSAWWDDTLAAALRGHGPTSWGCVQGLSQTEHFGRWTGAFDAAGQPVQTIPADWRTLLYQPWGAHAPAGNYLISDTDFVEVLTEIDIQTPIPLEVQALRRDRGFLFLGMRFDDQLTRGFARQVMKRSCDRHWAVLPDEPTRMERRFLQEQNIQRIACPLAHFAPLLEQALQRQPV